MGYLVKFAKLSWSDKKLLFETVILLLWVKLMIKLLPMRWYATRLGQQHAITPTGSLPAHAHDVFKLSRAIVRCRKIIPGTNRCYIEAITAKILLKRRHMESTLYIGVKKENNKLTAHAWLRCGSIYVTGKLEMDQFITVNTFS
jgi:hypothetical protein